MALDGSRTMRHVVEIHDAVPRCQPLCARSGGSGVRSTGLGAQCLNYSRSVGENATIICCDQGPDRPGLNGVRAPRGPARAPAPPLSAAAAQRRARARRPRAVGVLFGTIWLSARDPQRGTLGTTAGASPRTANQPPSGRVQNGEDDGRSIGAGLYPDVAVSADGGGGCVRHEQ
eukprot:gene10053-biopygen21284